MQPARRIGGRGESRRPLVGRHCKGKDGGGGPRRHHRSQVGKKRRGGGRRAVAGRGGDAPVSSTTPLHCVQQHVRAEFEIMDDGGAPREAPLRPVVVRVPARRRAVSPPDPTCQRRAG